MEFFKTKNLQMAEEAGRFYNMEKLNKDKKRDEIDEEYKNIMNDIEIYNKLRKENMSYVARQMFVDEIEKTLDGKVPAWIVRDTMITLSDNKYVYSRLCEQLEDCLYKHGLMTEYFGYSAIEIFNYFIAKKLFWNLFTDIFTSLTGCAVEMKQIVVDIMTQEILDGENLIKNITDDEYTSISFMETTGCDLDGLLADLIHKIKF